MRGRSAADCRAMGRAVSESNREARFAFNAIGLGVLALAVYVGMVGLMVWNKSEDERRDPCLELGPPHKAGMIASHRHCVKRASDTLRSSP